MGHATCKGGSLPLNAFGEDLKQADFKWTKALCEKDSDGDGQSNGAELGDPCCVWEFESLALPNFASHDVRCASLGRAPSFAILLRLTRNGVPLSHPGSASSRSTTAAAPTARACQESAAVGSAVSAPADYFLEGETRCA